MAGKENQEAILDDFIHHKTTHCESKLRQYHETGEPCCLDEAIQVSRASLDMPRHPATEPILLMILSKSLLHRYVVIGKHADLQEAISTAELAVTATPEGNPNLPSYIGHLADALERLYTPTGPSNFLEQGWRTASLATRLHTIYKRNGVVMLLQEAIRLAQVAAEATPEGHREHPGRLDTLGTLLIARFERIGALEDLREAVRRSEEAAAATPVDHPDRARVLYNLGNRLSTRFDRTGALEDLHEAIRRGEESVAATPVDNPNRAIVLNSLGSHLSTRFDRTGALEDLREAIRRSEEAVVATPVDHPVVNIDS